MVNIGIVITDPKSERKKQELVAYSKKDLGVKMFNLNIWLIEKVFVLFPEI